MPNPRGVQLVDEVVASVSAEPGRLVLDYASWVGAWLEGPPRPVPADVLATLTFPSGRPLPLRRDLPRSALQQCGLTPATHIGAPTSARFARCFLLPEAPTS